MLVAGALAPAAVMAQSEHEGMDHTMHEGMADMSRGLAAKARELNLTRKAEGRRRLAALIADVDASIAGGLITGEQGAKLDAAIARAAEGLRP